MPVLVVTVYYSPQRRKNEPWAAAALIAASGLKIQEKVKSSTANWNCSR